MKAIKETNIEEMILLGDLVLKEIMFNYPYYDESGNDLLKKCRVGNDGKIDHAKARMVFKDNFEDMNQFLLLFLTRQPYSSEEVSQMTLAQLIWILDPVINKAVGIFRKGIIQDFVCNTVNFYADESVSDEYLKNLFAIRVRDLMILRAAQRNDKYYYLLMYGFECCHDGDLWVMITDNYQEVMEAYEDELGESSYQDYLDGQKLMIYEFSSEKLEYRLIKSGDIKGRDR